MAEAFFATLEKELLRAGPFKSQAEAKTATFRFVDGKPHRLHSALGYLSPVNFERRLITQQYAPRS